MNYGYARVSAIDQNLNRQIDALMQFGIRPTEIFTDKKSGKDFQRESYVQMKGVLAEGDLLVIHSIDRLGRDYEMIIEEWADITRRIGADILVLDMPILDTRYNKENLTGKLISDIVLQLLSYVAQRERENIRTRQREGIASAKSRGVKFGRPNVSLPKDFILTAGEYRNGEISLDGALKKTGLKKSTFYKNLKLLER